MLKIDALKVGMIAPLALSLGLMSCQSTNERTGKGAVGGAVVGGVIGAAKGGARGAAIGAATGAAAGAAVGAYLDKRAKELSEVVPTKKTDRGLLVTLRNDLLFGFDEADLQDGAQKTLSELAEILKKYPEDQLQLAGYTDLIGSANYNQQLSEKRAEAVRGYLSKKGIDKKRMAAIGLGETQATGESESERQKDRRVEIYIQPDLPEKTKS